MCFFNKIKWKYYDIRLFIKSKYQKLVYGFEFRDCWNLYYAHSKWILPRLKHLRNNLNSTPTKPDGETTETDPKAFSIEEWQEILDKMIFAFEFVLKEDDYLMECYPKDYDCGFNVDKEGYLVRKDTRKPDYTEFNKKQKRYQEGILLFAQFYNSLWD